MDLFFRKHIMDQFAQSITTKRNLMITMKCDAPVELTGCHEGEREVYNDRSGNVEYIFPVLLQRMLIFQLLKISVTRLYSSSVITKFPYQAYSK